MNRREWTVATLRVLAIWWVMRFLVALVALLGSWTLPHDPRPLSDMQWLLMSAGITKVAIQLSLAVLAWSLSWKLASTIWRSGSELRQGVAPAPDALQVGLVSIAGLVLVVLPIPTLALDLVEFLSELWGNVASPSSLSHPGALAIGFALQVAFGLWLLMRPGFFAGLVPRCWNA